MGVNSIVQQVVRCDGDLQPVLVENRIKKGGYRLRPAITLAMCQPWHGMAVKTMLGVRHL